MTLADARRMLARSFAAAGVESPDLDARILVGHATGLEHAALIAAAEHRLTSDDAALLDAYSQRRLRHEPVAYIVGRKEFWGMSLEVTPATLIPRPETESVVEAALRAVAHPSEPCIIADVGTGSGALLLALLAELPQAYGVGTDIDMEALRVARRNARAHGLDRRSAFVQADFAAPFSGGLGLIVSNPPYVTTEEMATLAPDVRVHEPWRALDGGKDGLDAYRALARQCATLLAPAGTLVAEIGLGQAGGVSELFLAEGWRLHATAADLGGIPRALALRRD
jgi:release factor glutamine methyltransferase